MSFHGALGITFEEMVVAGMARGTMEFDIFGERLPPETLGEYGITIGQYTNHSFAYASAGAGLSALRFEERTPYGWKNPDCRTRMFCADSVFATRTTWTVGVPVAVVLALKLWYIGAGLSFFGNANLHDSYVGFSTIIFLGGGRTRSTPARDRPERD